MKRNDWLLIASAIIFSVLFYKQATGVNYLLFTGLVTGLIAYFNSDNIKKRQWWYYAAITNLCGFAVFYCNSNLSVFATILSLFIFSGKSFNYKNSIIINLFFSIGSVAASIVFAIIDYVNLRKQHVTSEKKKNRKIYFGVTIALVIAIVFFALYQQANPLFKDFTKNIDLSWISIGWCLFAIWGFLVLYGLIYYKDIKIFSDWDIKFNRTLVNNSHETTEPKEINNNTVIALSLFGLLNLMLVLVNALDLKNLLGTHELPKGIYLSDFVHSAVWSLVFSILIAVGLIMWFFKGDLNFNKQSKILKYLVYFWIIQNAIMVISAMVRNLWYVSEYQLTYLRIGVYVFLALSLVGLVITFLKVNKTKSAWYLVRQNFEAWLLILGLCSIVNWDKLISDYNISNAKSFKALDKVYLVNLSNANLPDLTELFFKEKKDSLLNATTDFQKQYEFKNLSTRIYNFILEEKTETWQSFNLRDKIIIERMEQQFNDGLITNLALDYNWNVELKNLIRLKTLRALTLGNPTTDFEYIAFFKDLEELTMGNFTGARLKNIIFNTKLKKLTVLNYFDGEKDFNYFKFLNNLEHMELPSITNEDLLKLNGHPSLQTLQLISVFEEQREFIKNNRLSFKVIEGGVYASR
ncbi:MAG: DUF4173 domain-containing protein [Bacteroidetes bacterium]|nr:DUF4173 domain-containing protein [Bacteroidota bacterium]